MLKYVSAAAVAFAMLTAPMVVSVNAEPKKEQSDAQKAYHDRQKKCGEEWQKMKTDNKVPKGMTWKTFWPDCNKRLKGA
jgi:hypothetical protein